MRVSISLRHHRVLVCEILPRRVELVRGDSIEFLKDVQAVDPNLADVHKSTDGGGILERGRKMVP